MLTQINVLRLRWFSVLELRRNSRDLITRMLKNKTFVSGDNLLSHKCKCGQRDLYSHLFPPKINSNYAIHILLREIMEILHFYIIIKSDVGVDFDVPHNVPLRLVSLNNIKLHLISLIMYEYL